MKHIAMDQNSKYILSNEQKTYYRDNGYLVIKGLIDLDTLYACKQRFIQICNGEVDHGPMIVMKEQSLIDKGLVGERLINKVQEILYDKVLSTYTEHPLLLDVISQFIGDNITAVHSMLINKPPGTGRHAPHQDMIYFPFRPAEKIIAVWTAIDDVYVDNGCLYVIPGSHKANELYKHNNQGTNKFYNGIKDEFFLAPIKKRVNLEMSPGDTVFFHPLLIHGSGPNVTKNYRKSISCHYANSECEYIDVSKNVQENVVQEVQNYLKEKGLRDLTYIDLWRLKSKMVKGVKCNL